VYLQILKQLNVFTMVDCNLWESKENTAAENGVFFGWTSESSCMSACLASKSCVAFDFGFIGCVLHHNESGLVTTYHASGITHFIFNRHCLPSTATEIRLTTTTSIKTTTGM